MCSKIKHIIVKSFVDEAKMKVEDNKHYRKKEHMTSNGIRVILEFPEDISKDESNISADLKNIIESIILKNLMQE